MTETDTRELAKGVAALVSREFDSPALHAFIDSGDLRKPGLDGMAREIGCFSLALPERFDGLGLDMVDMVPVYSVVGAYMPPLPLFAIALAGDLLEWVGADHWLGRMARGVSAAVSLPPHAPCPTLSSEPDGLRCTGTIPLLLDGADAQVLIFRALHDGCPVWLACPAATPGIEVVPVSLIDETRHAARITFADVAIPAESMIARQDECAGFESRLLAHAALALAADSAGGAEAIIGKTIEYMKVREQFGRPIGSFQALKHRAANLHLRLVVSQSLLEEAAHACKSGAGDARELALLACAHAADAYAMIAEDALQLHGGIGFTREHDAHVHLKRAKLNQALLGGTQALRDAAAGIA